MVGVILIVLALVVVVPVGVLVSGGVVAAIIGHFLKGDAELSHAGSELIDLNK